MLSILHSIHPLIDDRTLNNETVKLYVSATVFDVIERYINTNMLVR